MLYPSTFGIEMKRRDNNYTQSLAWAIGSCKVKVELRLFLTRLLFYSFMSWQMLNRIYILQQRTSI